MFKLLKEFEVNIFFIHWVNSICIKTQIYVMCTNKITRKCQHNLASDPYNLGIMKIITLISFNIQNKRNHLYTLFTKFSQNKTEIVIRLEIVFPIYVKIIV